MNKVLRFVGYVLSAICLACVLGCAAIGALFVGAVLFGGGQ